MRTTTFLLVAITSVASIASAFPQSVPAGSQVDVVRKGLNPLLLGANCTADAECLSEKCWPNHWYYGQKVCSPSPAGVPCFDGSTCLSNLCTNGICDKNNGTSYNLHGPDGPLCYTTNDCYSDLCMAPFYGGGQNTQCWPAKVGHACDARTGCITGNCTAGICSATTNGYCFSSADCIPPYYCGILSTSSPSGYCQRNGS